MKKLLLLFALALASCEGEEQNEITLEYDAYCPLHVEEGKEYHKVLPMCEEKGKIIIYNDSIDFIGASDSLSFVLYPFSFHGEPRMSRMLCRTSSGKDAIFLLGDIPFSNKYEVCVLMQNEGHYFSIVHVR